MATLAQLLEMPEAPQLQTTFVVKLPDELAASLHDWFQKASKWEEPGGIDKFAQQVLECALAEYRLEHLPASLESFETSNKLNDAEKRELYDLRDDENLSVVELAVRFGVGRSTIRRVLDERKVDLGIVVKKKASLDKAQIEEIVRLSQVEHVSITELAKRFDRTETRIKQILLAHRKFDEQI